MPKETFVPKDFRDKSLAKIAIASEILNEYARMGYDLSVRQLYYQMVARDYIPNNQRSYNRLKKLISDARLAGLIDWNMIVDRGRKTEFAPHWDTPGDIVRSAAAQFQIDKWEDQPVHIEVMIEKQALEGVLAPVCAELDVRFTSNKGYSSQSMMYRIGQRLAWKMQDEDKTVVVLYLGDHDPSGMDMDRDIEDRLSMFSYTLFQPIRVDRLALLYEQIEEMRPPENPAKFSDPRAEAYIAQFGHSSWELDAVEPKELARLVRRAVKDLRDPDLWEEAVNREEAMKQDLSDFADQYEES